MDTTEGGFDEDDAASENASCFRQNNDIKIIEMKVWIVFILSFLHMRGGFKFLGNI